MRYPLTLTFKILAVAPQIRVTDADGTPLLYVHQKAFALREAVTVYRSEARQNVVFTIAADRVLDFNAVYAITDGQGRRLGALARRGRRSIWKARYDILDDQGRSVFRVHEDNAWTKVLDGLAQQIPLVGSLAGYFFNPSYTVEADDPATPEQEGDPAVRLVKQPAFWEGRFSLERLGTLAVEQEALVLAALLMMLLRERSRG